MRFGDAYVRHNDGTLDVIRGGAKRPYSYTSGDWTDVEGDQKSWKNGRFWGSRQPSECRRRKGFPHPSRCGHGNGRHRADPLGGYVLPRHHSPERGDETSRGGPAASYTPIGSCGWRLPGQRLFNSFGNLAVDPTAAAIHRPERAHCSCQAARRRMEHPGRRQLDQFLTTTAQVFAAA
jgi:hypothetical protein